MTDICYILWRDKKVNSEIPYINKMASSGGYRISQKGS